MEKRSKKGGYIAVVSKGSERYRSNNTRKLRSSVKNTKPKTKRSRTIKSTILKTRKTQSKLYSYFPKLF